ncbi:MAG: Hsp70 family protein [Myxococcota bacterium]
MTAVNEPVLGIDLGTTFSTAALVVNGKFHYATDERGEACIPSVVHFPRNGPPLVGAEADKLRASDPENTVWAIKRVIARPLDSPQARRLQAGAVFKLVGTGAEEVKVRTRTGDYGASEVASLIMRNLKDRAQQRFGRALTKAVVTVPVPAPPNVREAMVRIGRMAGLEVVRVISEPVAGALARGIAGAQDSGAPRLIFDFGGGTLDVTAVQHAGDQVKVLGAGGDDSLGGDDFDTAFARSVASHVWGSFQFDVTRDVILADAIQRTCERVKRALSAAPSARYFIPEALGVRGRRWNIEMTVSRTAMSAVWAELISRAVEVTRQTLEATGVTPAQLSMVSLIGGTTFIPQVREAVAAHFQRPLDLEADPQTAVARGAAFLGAMPSLIR